MTKVSPAMLAKIGDLQARDQARDLGARARAAKLPGGGFYPGRLLLPAMPIREAGLLMIAALTAPKPKASDVRTIQPNHLTTQEARGAALDAAEAAAPWPYVARDYGPDAIDPWSILADARSRYFSSLLTANFKTRMKEWQRKHAQGDDERLNTLFTAKEAARGHLAALVALDQCFYTAREHCDAEAAVVFTEGTYEIAFAKWRNHIQDVSRARAENERQRKADDARYIVRRHPRHRALVRHI